jgi:DHA1 family inner membrane transport protein
MGILIALAVVMAVFAHTSHSQIAAGITVFIWGIAAFATVPPLQMRVVEKAKAAPNLASTLNIGAFNVGNAGGAWLGGLAIGHGYGLDALPYVAAVVALAALALTWIAARMDAPAAVVTREVRERV